MTKSLVFLAAISTMMVMTSATSAHPGAKILTTTSQEERTAMTQGMSYEDVNGVHIFRGRPTPVRSARAQSNKQTHCTCSTNIIVMQRGYRSFRGLRSQGFYSGTGPKSRRYTQGFYSGD